jgi:predicted nucleotidyltransferase
MVNLASIRKAKKTRKKNLQKALNNILNQLKKIGVIKIFFFGSFNEDNIDLYSDLDLLVIMPNSKTTKEWINLIYSNLERRIATDLVIFNEEDFGNMLPKSSFLDNIIKNGKKIYETTE